VIYVTKELKKIIAIAVKERLGRRRKVKFKLRELKFRSMNIEKYTKTTILAFLSLLYSIEVWLKTQEKRKRG